MELAVMEVNVIAMVALKTHRREGVCAIGWGISVQCRRIPM